MEEPEKLISYKQIDERFGEFRTGDLALSCRDDIPGVFILFFTGSNVQHSAITCWVDRKQYQKNRSIKIIPFDRNDDLLMFIHITKRKIWDCYSQSRKSGLVMSSLDYFIRDNLMTVWRRGLSTNISDQTATECVSNYLENRHSILEYENDIRTILGVPAGIVHAPYEHRKICTSMVCDYLARSYGYPFLSERKGGAEANPENFETRGLTFVLPKRDFEIYRALDFQYDYNQSPVLSDRPENIVYGYVKTMASTTIHPVIIIMLTVLGVIFMIIVWYFLFVDYKKKYK